MRSLVIIAHDIRSAHNVGSLLRTADGFGVEHVYLTGVTPYPEQEDDNRLPHISKKLTMQIDKTALGASKTVNWSHYHSVNELIAKLKGEGFRILGLEQSDKSTALDNYTPPKKCAIVLGTEVTGIDQALLNKCDEIIEITMYGKKESFNVVQAAAIALYVLREA